MKKHKNYSGQGFDYSGQVGRYEVKANKTKQFTGLSDAKRYYDSLKGNKALWDISGVPELLESQTN